MGTWKNINTTELTGMFQWMWTEFAWLCTGGYFTVY